MSVQLEAFIPPDGNTPPMFLNPSINTSENQASIAMVIGLFVSFFPIFYFFQIVVNRWVLGQEKWAQSISFSKSSVHIISANFLQIMNHLISIPTRKEIIASKGKMILPFVFLTGLFISFVLVQHAIASQRTGDMQKPYIINTTQAQAGLIVFFISCNGFLVSRINEYYKDKTEMRKKAAAHAFKMANDHRNRPVALATPKIEGTEAVGIDIPTKEVSPEIEEIYSVDEVSELSENVIPVVEDKPALPTNTTPHILPQYNRIHLSFGNFIQIAYRDLLVNTHFQASLSYNVATGLTDTMGNQVISSIRASFNLISSGLPKLDTLVLSNIKIAISWWISFIGVLVASAFILLKSSINSDGMRAYPRLRKLCKRIVEGTWIVYFQPLTSIFYLILLGSFIEPLGCLSSNKQPLWPPEVGNTEAESYVLLHNAINFREEQCAPVLLNPPMQVWFPIVGYIMGYYLLTIFKISDEQKPKEGIITFTTRSEVLNKNGSLSLLLLYTLIPTADSTTLRGIIAIFVISIMIFYQVRIGSSYIRPINFWRSISFTWVLWMSICIVYFTHPNQISFYGIGVANLGYRPWMRISLTIGLGWVFIFIVYAVLHVLVLRKMEKESTKPRTGISYNYNIKDDEDGPLTQLVNRVANGTAEPIKKMRNSFLTLSHNVGLPVPKPEQPPLQDTAHGSIQTTTSEPGISSVNSSDQSSNYGTIKSGTSGGSSGSSTSGSVIHPSVDRAAAYNSTLRTKVHGPRAPSLSRSDLMGDPHRSSYPSVTCDTIEVRGTKHQSLLQNGRVEYAGRVSVDSRPNSMTLESHKGEERQSRFDRIDRTSVTSGPLQKSQENLSGQFYKKSQDQLEAIVSPAEKTKFKARTTSLTGSPRSPDAETGPTADPPPTQNQGAARNSKFKSRKSSLPRVPADGIDSASASSSAPTKRPLGPRALNTTTVPEESESPTTSSNV
ncbi:hypothetical protein BDR26DRAFT_851491 [Obelidium mucronatum]|nr:hypothetical protein BDR26DRAFT_851491 [Obelidium mucronatum]